MDFEKTFNEVKETVEKEVKEKAQNIDVSKLAEKAKDIDLKNLNVKEAAGTVINTIMNGNKEEKK